MPPSKAGVTLVPLDANPIDRIWADRPAPPLAPVEIHPISYAGELAKDKLARLAAAIAAEGATHTVLTDPSSIAWAFNIRGGDVPHTPLALGFAVLAAEGPHLLFMDKRKLPMVAEAYLTQLADLRAPATLDDEIAALAKTGAKIALDPALAAERLKTLVIGNGGSVVPAADPARIPRATKNRAEIEGSRAAHRRDGAALAHLLCWLDGQKPDTLDEITVVTRLEEARRLIGEETQMPLRDVSFVDHRRCRPQRRDHALPRVARYQPHCATASFSCSTPAPSIRTAPPTSPGPCPIGRPTDEMRERYTLVLKGMIGISLLRFPAGTRGADIDAVARLALWKAGLDFAHGTGHGVGSYLAVHEGPQRIARTGTQKLLEGMMLSNEPGYYKPGALRHPAGKPRPGHAAEPNSRRRHRHARFRDADARPLRPPHARHRTAQPRGTAVAGCLSRQGAGRDRPDGRRRDARLADRGHRAAAARRQALIQRQEAVATAPQR